MSMSRNMCRSAQRGAQKLQLCPSETPLVVSALYRFLINGTHCIGVRDDEITVMTPIIQHAWVSDQWGVSCERVIWCEATAWPNMKLLDCAERCLKGKGLNGETYCMKDLTLCVCVFCAYDPSVSVILRPVTQGTRSWVSNVSPSPAQCNHLFMPPAGVFGCVRRFFFSLLSWQTDLSSSTHFVSVFPRLRNRNQFLIFSENWAEERKKPPPGSVTEMLLEKMLSGAGFKHTVHAPPPPPFLLYFF